MTTQDSDDDYDTNVNVGSVEEDYSLDKLRKILKQTKKP